MMKIDQNDSATKFLLGKLTEEEQAKIEKEYFHNHKLFENILIAENELIDAYATGNLSTEEHQRFESRLLINPHQRQRVDFAKTLAKYTANFPAEISNISPVKFSWSSIISLLLSHKPLLSFSFVAALLVFVAGGVWLTSDTSVPQISQVNENASIEISPTPLQIQELTVEVNKGNKIAETNKQVSAPARKSVQDKTPQDTGHEAPIKNNAPAIFSFVLSPGLTRASGTSQKFSIPAKTDFVKMQMKFEENNYFSYQATLETVEGNQVWSSKEIKIKKGDKSIDVLIPTKLLKKADYILSLKGLTKGGVFERVEDYSFTISP